ncbi:hypothetical protein chiPu_0021272 [Chiloscyllium punctatum]|uniref:Uncharacterized protein n=1 Tax=Chiloscyllium punctatum TaxID=137246 RepID=A0A401RPK5_CHIPU|nr:hypothetical protein [Chiloscyllium punctatum]
MEVGSREMMEGRDSLCVQKRVTDFSMAAPLQRASSPGTRSDNPSNLVPFFSGQRNEAIQPSDSVLLFQVMAELVAMPGRGMVEARIGI